MTETPFIKICSLREPAHASWVIDARASHYGLIFAPSRRRVSAQQAMAIAQEARRRSSNDEPAAIGVFVDANVVAINDIVEALSLPLVQLHGSESPGYVSAVSVPAVKAIRPVPGETFDLVASRIDAYERGSRPPVAYLIEGFHPRHTGGQGVRADWEMARRLAERFRIILAGGLSPDNVAEAVGAVRPHGVDVSSGVETDGLKDQTKILAFVANARAAFEKVD